MKEKKVKRWIPISYILPPVKTKVELKRDFSVGAGGYTGNEILEWISVGHYSYFNDKLIWTIKRADGLTLTNSKPTHWRDIQKTDNKT